MKRKSAPLKASKARRTRRNPADRWALSPFTRADAKSDVVARYILHGTVPDPSQGYFEDREQAKKDIERLRTVAAQAQTYRAADTQEAGRDLAALLPKNNPKRNPRIDRDKSAMAYGYRQGFLQGHAEWGTPHPPEMRTATDAYAQGYRAGRHAASTSRDATPQQAVKYARGRVDARHRLNPKGAVQKIVVAWVIPDGAREEIYGEFVRSWDGSHQVPKTRTIPRAMTAMWLNEGTAADVKKAKQYLVTDRPPEGSTFGAVYTYPVTEKDPLGRAKRDALAAFAKKTAAPKRRRSR